MSKAVTLPDHQSVAAAARRLAGFAHATPLVRADALDAATGARVLVKAEVLQRTGSFKFRGAYNKLSQIPAERRAAGVVAYSSGNHAQGVASAAAVLAMPATIVMPADAPAIKRARVEAAGARIVDYDRERDSREAMAAEIAEKAGAVLVPPYDDPDIVSGQGTVGLEIAEAARSVGLALDAVIVPCSGGGLVSGIALGLEGAEGAPRVYSAEPEGFDDMARSLEAGAHRENARLSGSICDALLAPTPGEITFALARERLAGGVTASDEEVMAAMAFAFRELKLVAEPGGAVALAALLSGRIEAKGRTIVVVLSGGNVDPALFARVLERA